LFETILIALGAFSVNVSISVAQLFLALLIVFSAVKLYKTKDFTVLNDWPAKFFILMAASQLTSAFAGINPSISLSAVTSTWTYLYLFACMILFDGKNLNRVLAAFFAGSILNAFSGIYDVTITGMERAIGYYTHALTYGNAAAVVFIAALGLSFFVKFKDLKLRYLIYAAAVLSLIALIFSGSRGPILSTLLTVFLLSIYLYRLKAVAVISVLVVGFALFTASSPDFRKKLMTDRERQVGTTSASSVGTRIVLWKAAVKAISERPVFGFGSGTFKEYVDKNVTELVLSKAHAHNSYLHYAYSNGLLGLALLTGFIVSLFRYIIRRSKEYPPAKAAIFVLLVFLLEGLTENNFGDSEVVMLTMLLLAVLTARVGQNKNL